jgi:hypothetical protein
VDVGDGDITVTMGEPFLRPRVDVRVVDNDGRPIGGAHIATRDPDAYGRGCRNGPGAMNPIGSSGATATSSST